MQTADPTESILDSMNLDVPAWIKTLLLCSLAFSRIGIRDMQRPIEPAVLLFRVNYVLPLRHSVVPLRALGPTGFRPSATL